MKSFVKNHQNGMWVLTVITVMACVVKFLGEGVSVELAGHTISLGHADALTYGALLSPVLGVHGYLNRSRNKDEFSQKADDPDADNL